MRLAVPSDFTLYTIKRTSERSPVSAAIYCQALLQILITSSRNAIRTPLACARTVRTHGAREQSFPGCAREIRKL